MRKIINLHFLLGIVAVCAIIYYSFQYNARRQVLLALREERDQIQQTINEKKIYIHPQSLLVLINCERPIDTVRDNIKYFIDHGLHQSADFLFVNNGGECPMDVPKLNNTFFWTKETKCGDHGIWPLGVNYMKTEYQKEYKSFIYIDPIVRGPLLPPWSRMCWSDIFAGRINSEVKLTGISVDCGEGIREKHVQGMVLGTDRIGFELMRTEMTCANTISDYVPTEQRMTSPILKKGYKVFVTMAAFQTDKNYMQNCKHGDLHQGGKYFGGTMQPYEVVFLRTDKKMDDASIKRYSMFSDGARYSSYDRCSA